MEQNNSTIAIETIIEKNIPANIVSKEEKQTIIDYFFSSEDGFLKENKKILQRINENRIHFEKELFHKKYEQEMIDKIDTLVSFVSYAGVPKTDSIEQTPIEKTMKLFPKIKNLILLCSAESEVDAETIKNNMTGYRIEIKKIDINRFNDSYDKLKNSIHNGEIYEDETIIDLTLGLKMTSLAFYKISTEFGVKTVNWQEIQARNIDNRFIRVPGTNHFYFVDQPKLENYKLYRNIDRAIENFDFKTVYYLYDQINNKDMAIIYKGLSKVFNFSSFEEFSDFRNRINSFFEEMRKAKLNWEKFSQFNKLFILLQNVASSSDNTGEDKEDTLFLNLLENEEYCNKYDLNRGIENTTWLDDLNMDLLIEEERRVIYYFLLEEFARLKADGVFLMYQLSLEKLFEQIGNEEEIDLSSENKKIKNIESTHYIPDVIYSILERLIEKIPNTNLDFSFFNYEDFTVELKEIKEKVILTNDKLFFTAFNIEINLMEEKEINKCIYGKSVGKEIIRDLFKSDKREIKNFWKLIKVDNEGEFNDLADFELTALIKTPWSRFKNDINSLNNALEQYFELNYIGVRNQVVLILDDEKKYDLNKFKTAVFTINPYFLEERV